MGESNAQGKAVAGVVASIMVTALAVLFTSLPAWVLVAVVVLCALVLWVIFRREPEPEPPPPRDPMVRTSGPIREADLRDIERQGTLLDAEKIDRLRAEDIREPKTTQEEER